MSSVERRAQQRSKQNNVLQLTRIAAAIGLCFLSGATFAQAAESETAPDTVLDAVVVKGQVMQSEKSPFTSTELDQEQIRNAVVAQPQQLLNKVPGVSTNNYNLGGVADVISIRGFGGGAHGGDLGFVLDGIPLNEAMSHADGYGDLNVVIPLELESMRVHKGPTSVLYGNFNRAGLVEMRTRKSGQYRELDVSAGSFGTKDLQGAIGVSNEGGQFNGAVQLGHTDGFRRDSSFDKGTVAGRYDFFVNRDLDIAVSGRAYSGKWDSASYVTQSRFNSDPYGADPRVVADGGKKDFYTGRVDVNYALTSDIKLLTFAYATQQTLTRWYTRPTSTIASAPWSQREEAYDRQVYGAGANLNGRNALPGGSQLNWTAGIETYRETTAYQYYEGETARSRAGLTAVNQRTYQLNNNGAFAEAEWVPTKYFRPTVGMRYDAFTGACSKDGAETGTTACTGMSTYHNYSPKFGINSEVAKGVDLRTSWTKGFALPPVSAIFDQNASLSPNIFEQLEVGGKFTLARNLRADLAWYRLMSSNEVGVIGGVAQNFGKTRRSGVEIGLTWLPAPAWEVTATGATSNSKVLENANPAAVNSAVAGVPRKTGALEVAYRPELGFGGSAAIRHVSRAVVNLPSAAFPTQVYNKGYNVVDLGLTFTIGAMKSTQRFYVNVANALNKVYASSSNYSAGQQVYGVGAPRTINVGAQLSF